MQIYVRNLTLAVCATHQWLSGCVEKNDPLGLFITHIIILAPFLP